MRLTLSLMARTRHRYRAARGNKKTGKRQEPHIIGEKERRTFVQNLMQECTNEMWLTRSYLSKKQENLLSTKFIQSSKGNPLQSTNKKLTYDYCNKRYRINMPNHVSFEQRWSHLRVAEKWKVQDKDHHTKRELERHAQSVIPTRYPDFYPPAIEKWDEWNKIDGFGLNKDSNSTDIVAKLTLKQNSKKDKT